MGSVAQSAAGIQRRLSRAGFASGSPHDRAGESLARSLFPARIRAGSPEGGLTDEDRRRVPDERDERRSGGKAPCRKARETRLGKRGMEDSGKRGMAPKGGGRG